MDDVLSSCLWPPFWIWSNLLHILEFSVAFKAPCIDIQRQRPTQHYRQIIKTQTKDHRYTRFYSHHRYKYTCRSASQHKGPPNNTKIAMQQSKVRLATNKGSLSNTKILLNTQSFSWPHWQRSIKHQWPRLVNLASLTRTVWPVPLVREWVVVTRMWLT